MKVLVLGAGFGGLELTTRLSEASGGDVDITLIDQADAFIFGFSKLDVMFGRTEAEAVRHPYDGLVKPGVRFVQATIGALDPHRREVETDAGVFDADVMVVALGADLVPEATPGLVEVGNEFYTHHGAFATREVLSNFEGGRVVVGVCSTPFKCPPAPSETALLMHDFLVERGLRHGSDISLVMPLGAPVPPSPDASAALLTAFGERDIHWLPNRLVRELDPTSKSARFTDGEELAFDLFLGVPAHRAPDVVQRSGMCVDGWIPVNPKTLETEWPNVYAVGDVTSVGTPKAGVFAEGQAGVVADRIIATRRGQDPLIDYDGRGVCYLEFGHDRVALVDVTFRAGEAPVGYLEGPSAQLAAHKSTFATSRIRRWFNRDWITGAPHIGTAKP